MLEICVIISKNPGLKATNFLIFLSVVNKICIKSNLRKLVPYFGLLIQKKWGKVSAWFSEAESASIRSASKFCVDLDVRKNFNFFWKWPKNIFGKNLKILKIQKKNEIFEKFSIISKKDLRYDRVGGPWHLLWPQNPSKGCLGQLFPESWKNLPFGKFFISIFPKFSRKLSIPTYSLPGQPKTLLRYSSNSS